MTAQLLLALYAVSVALVVVLTGRRVMRRLAGAGPALGLWWLLPLAMGMPWLPALPIPRLHLPLVTSLPGPVLSTITTASDQAGLPWWCIVWMAGVATMLMRLLVHYLRVHRASRALPASFAASLRRDLGAAVLHRVRTHTLPAQPCCGRHAA